jgi:aminoglycoside phosphotransferase (APT) family kinase protein
VDDPGLLRVVPDNASASQARRRDRSADQSRRTPITFDKGRDLDHAGEVLEDWLRRRPDMPNVKVTELSYPDGAGLSNETILFRAELEGGANPVREELALRISPAQATRLCFDTLFETQARLLRVLHDEHRLRVPNIRWFEPDPRWFDRPFFVMDRARGRVPISDPVYNSTGWLHDATPTQRRKAWEAGLTELIRIHRVSPDGIRFLPGGTTSTPGLHQVLDGIRAEYAWACGGIEHPIIDRLWEWLETNIPDAPPVGLSWGDARMGNMMFDDDFQLVVVMDWELVSLGGSIMDLGWWLFFDAVHSDEYPRLDGLGDRRETIERWEQGTGLSAGDVAWYEILAAVRLATLVIRSMNLFKLEPNDWGPFARLAYDRLGWSGPSAV